MSGCVLRVSASDNVDLDSVLASLPMEPLAVFRRGSLPYPTAERATTSNGFNVLVSECDGMDLTGQIADALMFLERNRVALSRLAKAPGITGMSLDFGTEFSEDMMARTHRFPVPMLQVCGSMGISIAISVYRVSEDE